MERLADVDGNAYSYESRRVLRKKMNGAEVTTNRRGMSVTTFLPKQAGIFDGWKLEKVKRIKKEKAGGPFFFFFYFLFASKLSIFLFSSLFLGLASLERNYFCMVCWKGEFGEQARRRHYMQGECCYPPFFFFLPCLA